MKYNEIVLEEAKPNLGKPKEIYYNEGTAMYIIIWDKAFAVMNSTGKINKITTDMKAVVKQKKKDAFKDMEKIGGISKLPTVLKRLAKDHMDNYVVESEEIDFDELFEAASANIKKPIKKMVSELKHVGLTDEIRNDIVDAMTNHILDIEYHPNYTNLIPGGKNKPKFKYELKLDKLAMVFAKFFRAQFGRHALKKKTIDSKVQSSIMDKADNLFWKDFLLLYKKYIISLNGAIADNDDEDITYYKDKLATIFTFND